jgi:quaternary ammonium compound-resistance protein SugE
MAWVYLIIAGFLETGWAIGLKYSEGFSKLGPSIATIATMGLSFALLSLALRSLPLGTAYAVWTGIGTVGTVILGFVLFKDPVEPLRLACLALIMAGVAGLKILAPQS